MSTNIHRLRSVREVPLTSLHEHALSSLVPDMRPDEWRDFYDDVALNGIKVPLEVLADGTVIDGRHRFRAAKQAGMTRVPVVDPHLNSDSPELYMLKAAVLRRHLSDDQRATVAAGWAEMNAKPKGGDMRAKGDTLPPLVNHPTRTEAATTFQVSREKVKDATTLRRQAPALFEQVRTGDISLQEARRKVKKQRREQTRVENAAKVQASPDIATLTGLFSTLVVDPPWDWDDEGDVDQLGRGRPTYHTMTFKELLAFPVGEKAARDAHIYLWITNRSLPKGFALLEAWGFRYITCLTWVKNTYGMGNYFRGQTEQILFGVRGSLPLLRNDVGTWFAAPRGVAHSAKPAEMYALVESCSHGPYLEIFGPAERKGWTTWGVPL